MKRSNDAIWFAALALFLLGLADARAQSDEERAKAAFEQVQGAAAGKGNKSAGGTAVQGQYGAKEFKGALSDPQKVGPDGTPVPAPKGDEKPKTEVNPWSMGLKTGAAGAAIGLIGGPKGALIGGAIGFVGGVAFGYTMNAFGRWMDNTVKGRDEALGRAGQS